MKQKFSRFLTLLLAFVVHISVCTRKKHHGISLLMLPASHFLELIYLSKEVKGTQTDFDGKYSIKASVGNILIFTYIGQKTAERTVGSSNLINVQMTEDAEQLGEVVVTAALGQSRAAKTLSYAAQQIDNEDLNITQDANTKQQLLVKSQGYKYKDKLVLN